MQRVLADVEATSAEGRALSGMARGRLAVGATPSLITSALAPALVEFHESHPGIDLSVVEAGSHQLVPQVATGEVDLALVVLPVTDPLVVTTPLFDDPLVLATAPDHPLNPPFLVPLVEVIETQWTSPQAVAWTMELHAGGGQKAGACEERTCRASSATGFSMRCGAKRFRWSNTASATPRRSMTWSRPRSAAGLPVLGPLENADQVGTDLTLAIHDIVLPAIENRPGPVALSAGPRGRREARLQVRRRLSEMDTGAAGGAARAGDAASESDARDVTKTLPPLWGG